MVLLALWLFLLYQASRINFFFPSRLVSLLNLCSLLLSRFKFPGRQKIIESSKWGFTKYTRPTYKRMLAEGRLIIDGNQVKYIAQHGRLDA